MPKEFCKLFHAADVGQVLVILESDENGDPAVNVKFRIVCMTDMMDMTAMAWIITSFSGENMGFDKEEDAETWAWEQAEKAFDAVTEESALVMARKTISDFGAMFSEVGGHA